MTIREHKLGKSVVFSLDIAIFCKNHFSPVPLIVW